MPFRKMEITFLFLEIVLTSQYMQMLTIEVTVFLSSEILMKCLQTWFMIQNKLNHILQAHMNLKSRN
jgi:hypothetical protein